MTAPAALRPRADLSEAERAELAALGGAVYPPEALAAWPGRDRDWARTEISLLLRDATGRLACHAGLLARDALCDAKPVRIGGIGGVMTHPEARRQGFAAEALRRALAHFFARGDIGVALLVCDPAMTGYYARQGWRAFAGETRVLQRGEPKLFTFNRVMLHGVAQAAPESGVIDLQGAPWQAAV